MTCPDYISLIQKCRTPRELEILLTRWHEVQGTLDEIKDVREAWLARSIALAEDAEHCAVAKGMVAA